MFSFLKNKKKSVIVLNIGHQKEAQGALNRFENVSEFLFNSFLADRVISLYQTNSIFYKEDLFRLKDILDIKICNQTSYSSLPKDINKLNPEFIISLHANAFNTTASGSEVLFAKGSSESKRLAGILQLNILDCLKLPNRGIKDLYEEDRGGYLLYKTKAPCVIIEPFFIDNDSDFRIATDRVSELAKAILYSILQFKGFLKESLVLGVINDSKE